MKIYRLYDKEGKSYIGSTVRDIEERIKAHFKIGDFSEKDFNWHVLEECETEEEMCEAELKWIKHYDAIYNGYNKSFAKRPKKRRALENLPKPKFSPIIQKNKNRSKMWNVRVSPEELYMIKRLGEKYNIQEGFRQHINDLYWKEFGSDSKDPDDQVYKL